MMKGLVRNGPFTSRCSKIPLLVTVGTVPSSVPSVRFPASTQWRGIQGLILRQCSLRAQASNVSIGSRGYEGRDEKEGSHVIANSLSSGSSSATYSFSMGVFFLLAWVFVPAFNPQNQWPYSLSIALVHSGCALVYSLIVFGKAEPLSLLAAVANAGFTAAFTLIFVSKIGDKVLLGLMGALSLMTMLSVVIGRIFQSVPSQFQTTLPIGEYAAIALLIFFGLKSIKDAWDLPSNEGKSGEKSTPEFDEYVEAEELVKEKVSKRLSNPREIIWKSFSLVFFTEWGDRSMLATIALGAAQSPWGVTSGAIGGHLFTTSIAILGGAFLANYIFEKLVGYLGGISFLVFAVATFLGVF